MIKKKKFALLVIAVALAFGVGASSEKASASTWHHGTPSALRGTWHTQSIKVANFYTKFHVYIGKNSIIDQGGLGDPVSTGTQSYHHTSGSHYYYVKGHENINTKGQEMFYYKFYKKGNKMRFINYLTILNGHRYSEHHYGYWYYK